MKLVIIGGTGLIGSKLVTKLRERSHDAVAASQDPREVVSDPSARYFGAALGLRTLVPGDGARLGEVRFQEWLNLSVPVAAAAAGR